jgi:nucleoside-diphosphate-sugar epimerase
MKALITGSSGFIGLHLVNALKKQEIETICLKHEILLDQLVLKEYLNSFGEIEYIFHLSGYGNHYIQKNEEKIVQANVQNLFNLLEITKESKYKSFINFSTSSVTLPIQTLYSTTKKCGETLCDYYRGKYNLPIISIRPYSVYGEGEADFRFIPRIIKCLINKERLELDCKPEHDWIYIEDFINAILIVNKNVNLIDKPIDIGTGISVSNWTIFKKLKDIYGKKFENVEEIDNLRVYDTDNWVANTKDIYSFGWKQLFSLEEGLRNVYSFYKRKFKKENI